MTRKVTTAWLRARPSAVMVAVCAACATMAATAGVSVLTADETAGAKRAYGQRTPDRPWGKRAVRAETPSVADATVPMKVPGMQELAWRAVEAVAPVLGAFPGSHGYPCRPLHEADEVPENFV